MMRVEASTLTVTGSEGGEESSVSVVDGGDMDERKARKSWRVRG